jgi:hypothetical protein
MRFPYVPFELNVLLRLGCVSNFVFKRFNVNCPVIVDTFVEVVVELIIISLGVEINEGGFVEFARIGIVDDDILDCNKLFKELLKVLLCNLQVEVA